MLPPNRAGHLSHPYHVRNYGAYEAVRRYEGR